LNLVSKNIAVLWWANSLDLLATSSCAKNRAMQSWTSDCIIKKKNPNGCQEGKRETIFNSICRASQLFGEK